MFGGSSVKLEFAYPSQPEGPLHYPSSCTASSLSLVVLLKDEAIG